MFCLYLRGQSTFWGYFFTVGALHHRPIGICCHFVPKWPFWVLASMEVGWPQRLLDLIKWHKSASHAKFDHYRTSGSWVMSDLSRKLQMHVPLWITETKETVDSTIILGVTSVLTHVQLLDVSGTHLDQLSSPKYPYFDTLCKSVALMVQKLECEQFLTCGMCTDMCRTCVRPRDMSVTYVGH